MQAHRLHSGNLTLSTPDWCGRGTGWDLCLVWEGEGGWDLCNQHQYQSAWLKLYLHIQCKQFQWVREKWIKLGTSWVNLSIKVLGKTAFFVFWPLDNAIKSSTLTAWTKNVHFTIDRIRSDQFFLIIASLPFFFWDLDHKMKVSRYWVLHFRAHYCP